MTPAGLVPLGAGISMLAGAFVLLPLAGDGVPTSALVLSYALVLAPVGAIVAGALMLGEGLSTPAVLVLGSVAALLGVAAAFLGGRPEDLVGGPAPLPITLLFVADVARILAACALALALARHVNSPGVAYLLAAAGAAADLFSVFAGPTQALMREGSPALDFLLLVFPTFGQPLGFALGVADAVFLALFAAVARRLGLRPLVTLAAGCMAAFLAMLAGLLSGTPLPALPFISLSFMLVNADLVARVPTGKPRR